MARLGVVMLVVGLVMLGYVGWQVWGTNYLSRQAQREAVAEVQRAWAEPPRGSVAASDPGGETGAEPSTSSPQTGGLGTATALIRIPRFGDDYVMPVFEGTSDDVLAKGFGKFEGNADPGQRGNFALAAHRVTHGEPLRDMPDLQPGDVVEVETRDHVFTYRLDTDPEDLIVTFQETWVVDRSPENPDPRGVSPVDRARLITLTTCAELFHTDDRMIAFGHLVSEREKDR